jgi:polyisoprenoid-binding protein YceI
MNRSSLTICACLASAITVTSGCKNQEDRASSMNAGDTKRAAAQGPDKPSISIPIPAVPKIATWELDPENSSVTFVCMHVRSKVRGMFAQPSGTVTLDEETPASSKVDATIDVNLISTGVDERDTHLKSADFFDVAKYPVATFVSTNVSRSNATSYSVTGNLTMRGITKPVTLAVTLSPPFNHAGGIRRGAEATASINRRDFNIEWDYAGEGTGVVVGDNIEITINAELVLRPALSEGPKTTDESAETKPSEPAGGGVIASSADYESKAMAAMDKMTAIFAAGGTDCDKVAADMIRFVDENKALFRSAKAWEKDHADEKKLFDTKVKARREDFMAKAGPTMQACKDHKGFQDASSAIERANRD